MFAFSAIKTLTFGAFSAIAMAAKHPAVPPPIMSMSVFSIFTSKFILLYHPSLVLGNMPF